MFSPQKAQENFQKLSYTEKYTKVKSVLALLEHSFPMYGDMLVYVTHMGDNHDEETLIRYYGIVMNNLASLQGDSLDSFIEEIHSFKKQIDQGRIKNLSKQESEEAEQLLRDLNN